VLQGTFTSSGFNFSADFAAVENEINCKLKTKNIEVSKRNQSRQE
jgi:hypothetical protein